MDTQQQKPTGERNEWDKPVKVTEALEQARRSAEDVAAGLGEQVREHPWRMCGIALAAGYIAGGGLFSRLTGRLLFAGLRIGVHVAALPLVHNEVSAFIDALTTERRKRAAVE